jgi:hypothetical protein
MRQLVGALFLGISFGLLLGPMAVVPVYEILTGWRKGPDGLWLTTTNDPAGICCGGVAGLLVFRRLSACQRPPHTKRLAGKRGRDLRISVE